MLRKIGKLFNFKFDISILILSFEIFFLIVKTRLMEYFVNFISLLLTEYKFVKVVKHC